MKKIKCKYCKKDIFQNSWNQLFCNASCRSKYYYYNRPRTRQLLQKRRKRYHSKYPERYKKYYNNFLKRNPGYRDQKHKDFIKKFGGYTKYYKQLKSQQKEEHE